jgi:hypothetical protein
MTLGNTAEVELHPASSQARRALDVIEVHTPVVNQCQGCIELP